MVRTGVVKLQDGGWDKIQRIFSWNGSPSLLCSETHQDHSLEPPDSKMLLVGTMVPVGPVSADGGVRLTRLWRQPDVSKPGQSLLFCSCCLVLRRGNHSGTAQNCDNHSACFARSYLLAGGLTRVPGRVKKPRGFESNTRCFESWPSF